MAISRRSCLRPPPPSAPCRRPAASFSRPSRRTGRSHRRFRAALRHRRGAGLNGIRATQWAVERFNAQGGIGGRKVDW